MKTSKKLQQIIAKLTEKHGVDLTLPEACLRLDMKGFDRLVIEKTGQKLVKVAHYYEQGSTLIADPEIIFFTGYPDWVPIEVTQSLGGHRVYAVLSADGESLTRIDLGHQVSLADLAELWAENIELQGWLDNGIKWTPCQNMQAQMPSIDTLVAWLEEGGSEATDGCWVEPDGVCPHGCQSWMLTLHLI